MFGLILFALIVTVIGLSLGLYRMCLRAVQRARSLEERFLMSQAPSDTTARLEAAIASLTTQCGRLAQGQEVLSRLLADRLPGLPPRPDRQPNEQTPH